MFPKRRARRRISRLLLPAFLWVVTGGSTLAQARAAEQDPAGTLLREADRLRFTLSPEARERLRNASEQLAQRRARRSGAQAPAPESQAVDDLQRAADEIAQIEESPATTVTKGRISSLRRRLTDLQARVGRGFDRADASLGAHGTGEMGERARSARQAFDDNMRALLDQLREAEEAPRDEDGRAALSEVLERLRTNSAARPASPLDPTVLPFRSREGKSRAPRLKDAEFAATSSRFARDASALTAAATAAPTPEELAPNEDVQITPAIQAKAASLGNQPLKIYDWVRNNVEFVPTYGSVQGSQMTLDSRRGNAFDIASLLIALLRSAGVGARYVMGTAEVPVASVMNWTGGAATAQVAQQILGQGGIPNVGLIRDSTLTHIRLEHVWVEAFIDYVPSRGAVHVQGDTWVPMDASFKLNTFTPASNLATAVPFDVSALSDQLLDSGEFDPATSRIANINQDLIFPFWESWQEQAHAYMEANHIDDTADGVLGGHAITPRTSSVFAGSLPYTVVARGAGLATLPAAVRHSVTLRGFASSFDKLLDNSSFTYHLSLPQLNSRRLGLRFDPATPADAAVIDNARQTNAASFPAYLIHLVPVVTLDGAAVATGPSARMGSTQPVDVVLDGPDGPTTVDYDNLISGDEIVFGITGNGVSEAVVQARFAAFPPDNPAEYLHQIQLHYWMESDYFASLTGRALGVHILRLPSVGVFSSPLTVRYLFGTPISAVYQSRLMDVKHSFMGAAGADPRKVVAAVVQAGYQGSFMEAQAFDQFENEPIRKSISAVQLIADAVTAGIPVYHVTPDNSSTVIPLLAVDEAVKNDVRNAVASGKTVLVPERNMDRGPWSGVGYIVQDGHTGAGAYLISGGASGGGLFDCLPELDPKWIVIFFIILLIILLFLLAPELAPALIPAFAFAAPGAAHVAATPVPRLVYSVTLLEAMLLSTSRVPAVP